MEMYKKSQVKLKTAIYYFIGLATILWYIGKQRSARSDASDQFLRCLLTTCTFKNLKGIVNHNPTRLKLEMDSSN